MNHYVIDFETKSRVNLRKSGAYRYVYDESTKIICAVIYSLKLRTVNLFKDIEYIPLFLKEICSVQNCCFIAHNATFEYLVLRKFFGKYINFSNVTFEDTRVYATQLGLPAKLEKLAVSIGVTEKEVDLGKRLISRYSIPTKKGTFREITPHVLNQYVKYCKTDVKVTYECYEWFQNNHVSMNKKALFDTIRINSRGIPLDIDLINKMISLRDEFLNEDLAEIQSYGIENVNSTQQIKQFCEERGVTLPSVTQAVVSEYLSKDDLPDQVCRLFEYRQKSSLSSLAKLDKAKYAVMPDHTIKGCFVYHKATTGRDAGALVQPQNMPRGEDLGEAYYDTVKKGSLSDLKFLYGEPTKVLKNGIRGIFYHPEGFYVGDFASIEARVLLWLCKDPHYADLQDGVDMYKALAADIYHKKIEDITTEERRIGKIAVLGLGYGMGANKGFKIQCDKFHIDMDLADRRKVVNTYRAKFKAVVKFWREVSRAFCYVIGSNRCIHVGDIGFGCYKGIVRIHLPSKRRIYFNKAAIGTEGITYWRCNGVSKKWEETYTYGGKLTENIVQAVAYDFMLHSFKTIETHGYKTVARVHDELIALHPGAPDVSEFQRLMEQQPEWAKGFPLKVDAKKIKRYAK